MNLLRDIAQFSSYRPTQGDILKLFQLTVEKELPQKEVVTFFASPEYFRQTKKKLKDKLLDGILLNSFSQLTKVQQHHFSTRKHYLEMLMLLQCGKKEAAINIAEETLVLAEKFGLVDIVLNISEELERYYSGIKVNPRKRKKYREKNILYKKYFDQQWEIQLLYNELAYCIQKKQPIEHIPDEIEKIKSYLVDNEEYKFRLYFYSLKILYAQYKSDNRTILITCKEATNFFSRKNTILPYTTIWNFKFQTIPIHLTNKDYARAQILINECLLLPNEGSFNWHLTLQYKAVLGFYSEKPQIVLQSWHQANSIKKKFQSEAITNRWNIIGAYLIFLDRVGITSFPKYFRTKKFLNNTKPNETAKVNLVIIELLNLLLNLNKKEYMNRVEHLESYLHYQRGKITQRARYFLRMLKCVETGDYTPLRVVAHAKKHYDKLKKLSSTININILDSEPVPYERLWGLVLSILKDQKMSKKGR